MINITREYATKLIKASKGSIFSVNFTKADGTLRDMVCRTGVSKGVNGRGMAYEPQDYDLMPVFDLQCKAWRSIRLDAVNRLTVKGRSYNVF